MPYTDFARGRENAKHRSRKWRLKNLERVRKYAREHAKMKWDSDPIYREKVKERNRQSYKRRYSANKTPFLKAQQTQRGARVYGITEEQLERLFAIQKNCCAICKSHQSSLNTRLQIDHDHETGVIRGLLCRRCNLMLGHVKESTTILWSMITYLKDPRLRVV